MIKDAYFVLLAFHINKFTLQSSIKQRKVIFKMKQCKVPLNINNVTKTGLLRKILAQELWKKYNCVGKDAFWHFHIKSRFLQRNVHPLWHSSLIQYFISISFYIYIYICVCVCACVSVSLFNNILTFVGYLMPSHPSRRSVVVQFNP